MKNAVALFLCPSLPLRVFIYANAMKPIFKYLNKPLRRNACVCIKCLFAYAHAACVDEYIKCAPDTQLMESL